MRRKIISLLIVCLMFIIMPGVTPSANAATTTQADKLIEHARSHVGDMYNTFDDREAFTTDWCSQFIQHCSAKAGLSKLIPTSGCSVVRDMAENVVNKKNGKITFVVKEYYDAKKTQYNSSRVFYDENYAPRKGDLILFGQYSYNNYPHIGIVASDSTSPRSNVHVIEGNTDSSVYTSSYVREKTNRSGNIVAYVTPAYDEGWPAINAGNVASSGKVKLSWNAHSTADNYYVYRASSKSGEYKYLGRTGGETSYVDTTGVASYLYYYKVKAVTSEGVVLSVSEIVSRTCDCAQPEITYIGNNAATGQIVLKWKDVQNADRYDIYSATGANGTYEKKITFETDLNTGKTYSFSTSINKPGTKYFFKVKARNSSNVGADSALSEKAYRICDLARPSVKATSTTKGKIDVKWNAVSGADKYEVYVATSENGTYSLKTTTKSCSYAHTGLAAGTTRYYKVRALMSGNSSATSAYSSIASATAAKSTIDDSEDVIDTDVIYTWPTEKKNREIPKNGQWGDNVPGHTNKNHYGLDIMGDKGDYVYAAADGYVDYVQTVDLGGYGLYIKLVHDNGEMTLYAHNSKILVIEDQEVDRGDVIAYIGNTGASNGNHLHFGIYKSLDAFNKEPHVSASAITYDPAKLLKESALGLKATNVESTGKVKLSWKKHKKATKYGVYRSTKKSTGYKLLKTTTALTYTDTSAVAGKLYYYRVKALNSAGTALENSDIEKRTCDCARPKISSISNVASSGKIKIKWKDVKNANRYDIYRNVNGGKFTKLTTVSTKMNTGKTFTYTDNSAKATKKYGYKVVARNTNNVGATSAGSAPKYDFCNLAKPTGLKASNATKGKVKLSWKAVDGASGYQIYRKVGKNGKYELFSASHECKYTDSRVKKWKTYYYKVRAVKTKQLEASSAQSAVVKVKVK